MSLIERKSIDEAYEKIKLARGYKRSEIVPRGEVLDMLLEAIDYAPTIDAVPVIRCKDCKKWNGVEAICDWWYCKTDSHFFCGYADKR